MTSPAVVNQINQTELISLSQEIYSGTYLIKSALSEQEKKQIIDIYDGVKNELYQPRLKSGHYMKVEMTCFGQHWNPIDNSYSRKRTNYDLNVARHIPMILKEIAGRYSISHFPYHSTDWDICVLNYYRPATSLGLHRDDAESREAMDVGHPIVSISIGSPCTFRIAGFTRESEYVDITLEDGDVLLMGGDSRMRFHGVPIIKKIENPPFYNALKGGRLNLTLRKK